MSLSIGTTYWAICLTSSTGKAAEVARKVAEVFGGEDDEETTEMAGFLGSVIAKQASFLAPPSVIFVK